jgi:hypothetical protein
VVQLEAKGIRKGHRKTILKALHLASSLLASPPPAPGVGPTPGPGPAPALAPSTAQPTAPPPYNLGEVVARVASNEYPPPHHPLRHAGGVTEEGAFDTYYCLARVLATNEVTDPELLGAIFEAFIRLEGSDGRSWHTRMWEVNAPELIVRKARQHLLSEASEDMARRAREPVVRVMGMRRRKESTSDPHVGLRTALRLTRMLAGVSQQVGEAGGCEMVVSALQIYRRMCLKEALELACALEPQNRGRLVQLNIKDAFILACEGADPKCLCLGLGDSEQRALSWLGIRCTWA